MLKIDCCFLAADASERLALTGFAVIFGFGVLVLATEIRADSPANNSYFTCRKDPKT